MRKHTGFVVPRGRAVYVKQAFKCCPYAGMITSQIHDFLEQNGYEVVDDPTIADAQLVNTCGSDAAQAQLTYDTIADVREQAPGSPIVIAGCLNSIEPKRIVAALDGVADTAMFDPRHLSGLDEVFETPVVRFESVRTSLKNRYAGTPFSAHWHHVGASTGCFGTCTFCAIRRATGRPRSNPIDSVIADVRRAIAVGHRDILLVSTDLSAWGADLGLTVVDLLTALVALPDHVLFSAEALEPTLLLQHFDALLPLFASGRFAFLGIPIQSGSQRILDQMERPYQIDAVLDAMERLKRAVPDLLLRTDIIYGFGDETDADFQASILAGRVFHVTSYNRYQQRPGTAPVLLGDDVLAARRERVTAELRYLAARGTPPVKRIVPLPPDESVDWDIEGTHESTDAVPVVAPPSDALLAWVAQTQTRFARVIDKRGGIRLGTSGWAVTATEVEEVQHAVVLVLTHPRGRTLRVGLRHPAEPGPAMARSDRFAMWLLEVGFTPTDGADDALRSLRDQLELRPA